MKSAISRLIGLFCLFWILVIGSYGVFSDISFAIDANERLAKAERVPAIITKVDTNESSVTDGKLFTPWVSYKFSYKGKEYSPGSWQLYDKWSPTVRTGEDAAKLLSPYKVGHTISAYVYPDNPSKSFLDPSNTNVFPGFYEKEMIFAGLLFFGLWLLTCLIGNAIKSMRPDTSLSERALALPALLGWVIFCDVMMIWYWTHTSPPHSGASYAWFAISLGIGLLGLFNWEALRTLYEAVSYILWFFFSPNIIRRKK